MSNMEDGRIYRLDSTGACLGTFDHATGTISASCAAEGGDVPGFVPLGERVWGLQVYNNRLYYGVWAEDFSNVSASVTNTIWSIALVGGSFSGTAVQEIALPPMPGGFSIPMSSPPADIAFSQTGCMLIAERGMSFDTWPAAHYAQVLEYRQTTSGVWVPSAFSFKLGDTGPDGTNSAGGVDYDRDGNVWATGDALQFWPLAVYGLQSLPCTGGDVTNSVIVDLNGVYSTSDKTEIGDVEVGCSEKCLAPPRGMTAWYPLDEAAAATKAEEIVWDRDGNFNGTTTTAGMVLAARHFNGAGDSIRVPSAAQHNFGTGDFSADLWVRSLATSGIHVMLDKRSTTGGSRGFSMFLGTGTLGFQLGDGAGFTNYPRTGLVADGQWHHLAVTVDRDSPTGLVMYVDGVGVTKDPTPHQGTLSSSSDLWIGARDPAFGQTFFAGDLDEIELFNRALSQGEVQALYQAGKQGKCKDRCHIPWDAQLCQNRNTVTVNLTICNDSPVTHSYVYSYSGNNNCSWPGPTVFSPPAGSVTIPANTCVQIPVTITKPVGMTAGNVACYNVNITNLDTGHQFGCEGSIWASDRWCRGSSVRVFRSVWPSACRSPSASRSTNDGDSSAVLNYTPGGLCPRTWIPTRPAAVSIDGLPPGEPVVGNRRGRAGRRHA
ncbi:MAG: LamG domain-containing protein [Phycisphaerales bacterium]|nr:LamG domain-containing protein [Phycisphaerales bacterium]